MELYQTAIEYFRNPSAVNAKSLWNCLRKCVCDENVHFWWNIGGIYHDEERTCLEPDGTVSIGFETSMEGSNQEYIMKLDASNRFRVYDCNSYSPRNNPSMILEASSPTEVRLLIENKVQGLTDWMNS